MFISRAFVGRANGDAHYVRKSDNKIYVYTYDTKIERERDKRETKRDEWNKQDEFSK